MNVRRLDTRDAGFETDFAPLVAIDAAIDPAIESAANAIVDDVRNRGDTALLEYTQRYDRLAVGSVAALEITQGEMHAAFDGLPPAQRDALQTAADRIRAFHREQHTRLMQGDWTSTEADGTITGQRIAPLDSAGLYVPGGKAAYPSSVLMNAIPAHVAGVERLIMVVPTPGGERNPLVLAAAGLGGVTRAFAVGGAQAVAALAYGTATVPAVDKIVGPGNAYVAAAKRRVFGTVGIDMIAGPTEILVIADGSAHPDWIAMDLFSQAEHDELAQALLLTPGCGAAGGGRSRDPAPSAGAAAARDHRGVAGQARRAGADARPRRGGCLVQPGCAGTHGDRYGGSPGFTAADPACGSDLCGALFVGIARRLLRRPQPRAAHRSHCALFFSARRLRLRQALECHRRVGRGRPATRPGRGRPGARRTPGRACDVGRVPPWRRADFLVNGRR